LGQGNFKKMLAYSSIAHMGIIVTGMGLGTVQGLAGALFHAINHMFMKSTAFFALGQLGRDRGFEMAAMQGTAWRAPLATAALITSVLSLIGLPPLAGFIGKWGITLDALREEHILHAAAIPFGALLSAIYYGRMVRVMFSDGDPGGASRETGGWLTGLVLIVGTAGCLIPFILWGVIDTLLVSLAALIRG
jgi:multicomponent Na+:H+ antiporter subunit D